MGKYDGLVDNQLKRQIELRDETIDSLLKAVVDREKTIKNLRELLDVALNKL